MTAEVKLVLSIAMKISLIQDELFLISRPGLSTVHRVTPCFYTKGAMMTIYSAMCVRLWIPVCRRPPGIQAAAVTGEHWSGGTGQYILATFYTSSGNFDIKLPSKASPQK